VENQIGRIEAMALTKAKKVEQVEKLHGEIEKAAGAIIATFTKLTVAQDFELRRTIRGAGAKYRVVKNRLAERAGKGTSLEAALQNLSGVTSVAFTHGDPVALAKALQKYTKDNPELIVKAGILDGRALRANEVEALASMPSREELMSKLLFLISAPAQRLVAAINAVGRNLAVVIDQGTKEGKFRAAE
jgi:large subunit ribosomal protein L10